MATLFCDRYFEGKIEIIMLFLIRSLQDDSRSELDSDADSSNDEFSSSKHIALKSKEASKRRLEAKARAVSHELLNSNQRESIRAKIKTLRADIQTDEKEATKFDKEIVKKTAALKKVLIKAKRIRREGDNKEKDAKEVISFRDLKKNLVLH
jgi:predicted RNA-binding Zn ribbon-like protein